MNQTKKPHLPIGYWLKQADNLITEQVNKVQAANGISRTDWQVFNTLYEVGSVSRERLFEVMSAFVDASGLDKIVSHLAERGWVESVEGDEGGMAFQLTGEGRQRHSLIFAAQKEARQRAMQGISEEEYATVIRVLQRIVSNLAGDTEE